MTHDDTQDGYNTSRLRVRFDAAPPTRVGFTQVWGSDQLATTDAAVRGGILSAKVMLLEIPWHRQGNVVFRFDLTGSAATYRAGCPERFARDAKEAEKRAEVATIRAEWARKSQAAAEERARKFSPFGKGWEMTRRHIEASGWSCPGVESLGLTETWYVEASCSGGMEYLIRQDGTVNELRRSGRRL